MDRRFVNVILLGFGFMFVFTAFQTMGNIEKTILDSIAQDDKSFTGDGYTSLAIIYATLAVCNWLAPSVITITGPRGAMIIGAITYLMNLNLLGARGGHQCRMAVLATIVSSGGRRQYFEHHQHGGAIYSSTMKYAPSTGDVTAGIEN